MSDLSDRIQVTIETEPVVAFIKGTHEQCMCGNSERALDALRAVGASFTAVDVLPDPAIRQELSALSSWPTIPQVFVGGELVGGADIVQELAASGGLEAKLNEKLGDSWRNGGEERTVEVTRCAVVVQQVRGGEDRVVRVVDRAAHAERAPRRWQELHRAAGAGLAGAATAAHPAADGRAARARRRNAALGGAGRPR